jgi:hypothetical protein
VRSDVLIVAYRTRQPRIECGGGVAARRTEADTVHLVSAAATPLGGDAIHIRVVVEDGARLRVRTAAATVTLPGSVTPESHSFWTLEVAGALDIDPQPTVVAATSRHFTSTRVELSGTARCRLREPMSGKDFGPARCTPTSTGHRCCGTASSSEADRWPTTSSGRRWPASANSTIPTVMSRPRALC